VPHQVAVSSSRLWAWIQGWQWDPGCDLEGVIQHKERCTQPLGWRRKTLGSWVLIPSSTFIS
jgi:hypothetical protein